MQSTSTAAAESTVPPAPVTDQRPVGVNEEATSNAHTAARSLWLLIAGLVIAVLIVARRIASRRRDTDTPRDRNEYVDRLLRLLADAGKGPSRPGPGQRGRKL